MLVRKKKIFVGILSITVICVVLYLLTVLINNLQYTPNISANDVALVQVCGETIYLSDINRTYDSLYGYMDSLDEDTIRMYKREILENGINELIIIYEGLAMGMDLDIESARLLVEQLKTEKPDIYSLADDQIGIERYTLDLARSNLIRDVRKIVLKDFSLPAISDDKLHNWYCEQLTALGQDQVVEYDTFLKNREYVYQKWKEQCENTYFNEWLAQKRAGYEVEYLIKEIS